MVFSTALLDFRNNGEAQGLLGQILGNYIDELDWHYRFFLPALRS